MGASESHSVSGPTESAEPPPASGAAMGDTPKIRLAMANLAAQFGRTDEAIAGYRAVLKMEPTNAEALLSLASLLLKRGFSDDADVEGGIEVCRAAIALLPEPAAAYAMLGGLLLAAGRLEESIEAYRQALTLAPLNAAAWVGLASTLIRTGDGATGLEAADAALSLSPDLPDALLARGNALLVLHQPEAAVAALERAVALAPQDARMHLGLGDAYAELDRAKEAIAHLHEATRLNPSSKWAHANLGSMLYRCGDLETAERHCRQALAADPDMASAHQNLAGILEDLGQADLARIHRDKAFTLSNLRVSRAATPKATVLVLTTAGSGNVPHRYLLPARSYTRIDWFIQYAQPGQREALPPYDVVFNIIGDPDYADDTIAPVAAFLEHCDRPVLNDPAKVARTRRDRLPDLLAGLDGVTVPKVARLAASGGSAPDLANWVETTGLAYPVLVRPIGSHGGEGLRLARSADDVADLDVSGGAYATAFVDFRSSTDGLYRKYRAIFVDRTPYPYHLAIADDWLVHYYRSQMGGDAARQAEERAFLEDPRSALGERTWAAIEAIGERLDLDFAGVDFSVLPDGRVLVFEANATMLVHPEADGEFAYKNAHVERITGAFQDLVGRRSR